MILTVGVLISVTIAFGILRLRLPAKSDTAHLGVMSETWLAEQRNAHGS